ncbi:MAG TPA: hypothetical protein VFE94_00335 [Candidatus Paceibacterota bacterium]|nr:hypothetical protein [Candidatus Paceibacterota bacterium]
MKETIYFRKWFCVLILLVLGVSVVIPSSLEARSSSRDARVQASFVQMKWIAELIYNEGNGGYESLQCASQGDYGREMQILCEDVEAQFDRKPVIHSGNEEYCAYAVLPSQDGYVCIDSTQGENQTLIITYINPGNAGYCNGTTFVCPTEVGTPSPLSVQERTLETSKFALLFVAGIFFVFVWWRSIKRRVRETPSRGVFEELKGEIASKKLYFSALVLFLLIPAVSWGIFVALYSEFLFDIPFPVHMALVSFFEVVSVYFFFASLLAPLVILALSLVPIQRSWKNPNEGVCWESYLAALCLSVTLFVLSYFSAGFERGAVELISFMLLISGLGVGLCISCIISKRKINKLMGIVLLCLFAVLLSIFITNLA